MTADANQFRATVKDALGCVGLLAPARALRDGVIRLVHPEQRRRWREQLRRERGYRDYFVAFERRYGKALSGSLSGPQAPTALVLGTCHPTLEVELTLLKALELAGFAPSVLMILRQPRIVDYYELAAVREIVTWPDFCGSPDFAGAEAILERCESIEGLLGFEHAGVRVGQIAVSTALRELRAGSLDLSVKPDRERLVKCLAMSMISVTAARRVLDAVRPQLVLFVDTEYTPKGELFESCLARGVDTLVYDVAHKSGVLGFKRYTAETRSEHPGTLSRESWDRVRRMPWSDAHRARLERELHDSYASGDWCSAVGTQFDKRLLEAQEARNRIGLDPGRKTAFLFPHILWDAGLSWGRILFRDYEDWLVETVRAACANPRVNWVVKIHPANLFKGAQEGFREEPAEVVALRRHVGELPDHVILVPADSDISTHSLFPLMDYCLTVRGTVGIEAARLGVPVLTAGMGRYSGRGFTIDSDTREQYLERLARIEEIEPLSQQQRELADRYAYGLFVLRPLALETVSFEYLQDEEGFDDLQINSKARVNIRTAIHVRSVEDWRDAKDLRSLVRWIASGRTDYLACDDEVLPGESGLAGDMGGRP